MRKLSSTQLSLVRDALSEPFATDQDYFFRVSVYPRNLRGLIRAGAVVEVDGRYVVSAEAAALASTSVEEGGGS